MVRSIRKASHKAGLPPGTLLHIGERKTEKVKMQIIDYDEKQFQHKEIEAIAECLPFKETPTVTWLNITGVHDLKIIEELGKGGMGKVYRVEEKKIKKRVALRHMVCEARCVSVGGQKNKAEVLICQT